MDQSLPFSPPPPQQYLLPEQKVFPLSMSLASPKPAVSSLWEHLFYWCKPNIAVLDNRSRADQLFVIMSIYYSSSSANWPSYAEGGLGLVPWILSDGEWRNSTLLSLHSTIFSNCLLCSPLPAKNYSSPCLCFCSSFTEKHWERLVSIINGFLGWLQLWRIKCTKSRLAYLNSSPGSSSTALPSLPFLEHKWIQAALTAHFLELYQYGQWAIVGCVAAWSHIQKHWPCTPSGDIH